MPALDRLTRLAETSLTVARRAGSVALSTARQVADTASERRSSSRKRRDATAPPHASSTTAPPAPAAATAPAPAAPPAPQPAPAAAAPADLAAPPAADEEHVDREAVLVAESSDEDAAAGPGAQIRVDAPWDGYDELNVKEVNDRLADASPEVLAVVRLYETANRNRVTVLKEIDRRLEATEG